MWGGTAADDALDGSWSVFSASGVSSAGVSLVGVGKGLAFGASMLGPYTPTGKRCIATKTRGRRVFEIDGGSAKDWVYAWLGDCVREQYDNGGMILPQTAQSPIGVTEQQNPGQHGYRTAHLAALGGQGETFVDFFAPVPEGSTLTVMDAGDGPATGYAAALSEAFDAANARLLDRSEAEATARAGLLIFCGGMAIAVGDALARGLTDEEFRSRTDGLQLMGVTCFGEQACIEHKGNVQRNLSVGLVLFG